ncbi:hypothetical protein E2C01_078241 [Portunus trituberculatus]|uniref:Uncharacterized protein n=1 Tax=Portunus trituberculatus TaxID=210409 RepID=A0A5B7IS70_PORTR|nr:hypothetical protein [Portunus trituberculatus]
MITSHNHTTIPHHHTTPLLHTPPHHITAPPYHTTTPHHHSTLHHITPPHHHTTTASVFISKVSLLGVALVLTHHHRWPGRLGIQGLGLEVAGRGRRPTPRDCGSGRSKISFVARDIF